MFLSWCRHPIARSRALCNRHGEPGAKARAAICGGLSWIGVDLDEVRNFSATEPISDPTSRCAVRVLASQEGEQIARHTRQLIDGRETRDNGRPSDEGS